MHLYHASNYDIAWPDEAAHRLYSDPSITGNKALGLFANTECQGSEIYGDRLYRFTLKPRAVVHEIPDDMRQPGRCGAYYYGIRDMARLLGIDAVKVTHEPDVVSFVILNFEAIATWDLVPWPY